MPCPQHLAGENMLRSKGRASPNERKPPDQAWRQDNHDPGVRRATRIDGVPHEQWPNYTEATRAWVCTELCFVVNDSLQGCCVNGATPPVRARAPPPHLANRSQASKRTPKKHSTTFENNPQDV